MIEGHVIEHNLPQITCWIDPQLRYHQDIGIGIDFKLVSPPPGVVARIDDVGVYSICQQVTKFYEDSRD